MLQDSHRWESKGLQASPMGGWLSIHLITCNRRRFGPSHPPKNKNPIHSTSEMHLTADADPAHPQGSDAAIGRKRDQRCGRKSLQLYFANVTSWGQAAQDYLVRPETPSPTAT